MGGFLPGLSGFNRGVNRFRAGNRAEEQAQALNEMMQMQIEAQRQQNIVGRTQAMQALRQQQLSADPAKVDQLFGPLLRGLTDPTEKGMAESIVASVRAGLVTPQEAMQELRYMQLYRYGVDPNFSAMTQMLLGGGALTPRGAAPSPSGAAAAPLPPPVPLGDGTYVYTTPDGSRHHVAVDASGNVTADFGLVP